MNTVRKLVLWSALSSMSMIAAHAGSGCCGSCSVGANDKGEKTEVKTP